MCSIKRIRHYGKEFITMLKVKVSETDTTTTATEAGLALFPSLHHYDSRISAQEYYLDSNENESIQFCQGRRSTGSTTTKAAPLLPKARGGCHIDDEHIRKKKQEKLFRHKVIIHTSTRTIISLCRSSQKTLITF